MNQKLKNTHKSKIKEYSIGNETYIVQLNNFTDSTDTILKGLDKRYIQFYFCTKGNLIFNFNHGSYKINLTDGHSFLFYNPNLDMPLNLNISAQSKVLIIAVSIKTLHSIFAQYNINNDIIERTQFDKFYEQKSFTSNMRAVLNQIENMNLNPAFENLYLLGKMYEMFTLYFANIEHKRDYCPYLDNEVQARKLKLAKDILVENLSKPPLMKDLCERVELSEYHLKEGFKKIYGNTVYGYVLDKKLEIAKEKLMAGQHKVKEIAFEIGYENPSHFIAAFKKKYGVTPKQFTKENN